MLMLLRRESEVPKRLEFGESLNVAHAAAICLYELSRHMEVEKKHVKKTRRLGKTQAGHPEVFSCF